MLRGSDLTRLIVTLGVASILYELANRFDNITTAASMACMASTSVRCWATSRSASTAKVAARYSAVVLFLLFLVARRVVHAPFGTRWRPSATTGCEATAIGIDANRRLAMVYTLAAAMAGAGG